MKKRLNGLGLTGISRNNVTVGADPEFELVNRLGNVVSAGRGGRRMSSIGGTGQNVEIGVDGAGSQIEFRPRYDISYLTLTTRFKNLLSRFGTEHRSHSLSWAGSRYPIGGHIHVGNPLLHDTLDGNRDAQLRLCEILDDFIDSKTRALNGNARSSYAGRGKIRMQDWGVEYRGAPAGVFASEALLRVTLRMTKAIVVRFASRERLSYENPPQLADYRKMGNMTAADAETFLSEVARLTEAKRLGNCDMLAAWGVRAPRVPPSPATLARRAAAVETRRLARLAREEAMREGRRLEREAADARWHERNAAQRLANEAAATARLAHPVNTHAVVISTHDEWNANAAFNLRDWATTLHTEVPVNVVLYGLSASRGEVVSNLELEGYETIAHSAPRGRYGSDSIGTIYIGLAYSIRSIYHVTTLERLKAALVRRLARTAWGVRAIASTEPTEAESEELANIADSGMPLTGAGAAEATPVAEVECDDPDHRHEAPTAGEIAARRWDEMGRRLER